MSDAKEIGESIAKKLVVADGSRVLVPGAGIFDVRTAEIALAISVGVRAEAVRLIKLALEQDRREHGDREFNAQTSNEPDHAT